MTLLRTLALLALLPCAATVAHADTMSADSVCPMALGSSADSFSLNHVTATSSLPGTLLQTGTFVVGDSGQLNQTFNFSFLDNITIDGITKAVRIFGSDNVTPAADTLSIFSTGPISFGSATYSLRAFNLTAANIQSYNMSLAADVTHTTTPEPAGLALMGSGALATAFAARRRVIFAGA